MARAVQRPAARKDFLVHYAYLHEKGSPAVAKRFREAVEANYAELAEMPSMGSPHRVPQGKYAGVRIWRVRGFENYLIAYRPHRNGVAIERLFHAKQDYMRVLQ